MKPIVIVLDGTDGSGKNTQTELLYQALKKDFNVEHLSFPRYEDAASTFVSRYLDGQYGKSADSVDPYTASLFYALDRYDYFKTHPLKDDSILLLDRYVTSNMIHQASKLSEKEREAYLNWLEDLEYNQLGIPKPDLVFFLDVNPETSETLIQERDRKQDIHETDPDYQNRSHDIARELANEKGWIRINCSKNGELRPREDIHKEIKKKVEELISERSDV